jgi:hypothetical protein
MRVEADAAEGELDHGGLAEDDRAGAAQARDDGRVGRGRRGVAPELRAGGRRLAGDVEEVLDRDQRAVERSERDAGASRASAASAAARAASG